MNDKAVKLRTAVLDLDSLPTMPVMAQKILSLPLDTPDGESHLLQLISQDPQISARIIGLANSPLFGTAHKIASIPDAAMILGITRVKSVAVGIAVMSALNRRPNGKLNIEHLWMHSLGIALAMCALAHGMPSGSRPLDDEIFFAGLLHDIGFMVLNHIDPASSDLLQIRLTTDVGRPIGEIEAELLEIGHGELGAELARHWDLPDDIVAVLLHHHDSPTEIAAGTGRTVSSLLNLAEKLLPAFGISEHVVPDIGTQDWLSLGIDPAHSEELAASARAQAEHARQIASTF